MCFVNTFNEKGKRLRECKVERSFHYPQTSFHKTSEHVVVAGIPEEQGKQTRLVILIYTTQGEEEGDIVYLRGNSVSIDGNIAVVIRDKLNFKVLVV